MNMFWNNVKSELEYQGLSQKELANKANLNIGTIRNQMTRAIMPDLESAYKIAQALNQPLEYLINGDIFQPNNLQLPTREIKLLENYRKLSDKEKHTIDLCAEVLASEYKESKEDIF